MELILPKLRPDQLHILKHPAKRKTCAMGRRYGKTILGLVVTANVLRQHGRSAWVTPTYKNGRPLWRAMVAAFAPLRAKGIVDISISERTITTKRGGFFGMYSADNIDSMRGEWFHVVVNDEAAKLSEEARYDVIDPLVADSDGEIIDISTPYGRNWFWKEFVAGQQQDGERASFTAPTSANPMPNIQKAFKLAKDRLPERTYRQEWLAEFVEGEGLVFRNIQACMKAKPTNPDEHRGHRIIAGCDWAKQSDFTAFSFGCVDCRCEVEKDRFNQIDYAFQVQRLQALCERWQPMAVLTEINSIGMPVFEQVERLGLPVIAFETTASSKPPLIESFALALEKTEWQFLPDPLWALELEAYERKVSTVTGRSQYGAPDGIHDDTVMARALMLWAAHHHAFAGSIDNTFW